MAGSGPVLPPPGALARLGATGAGSLPVTSTLAAPDFLLAARTGLRPVSQVMGSCVYHVGWQPQAFMRNWSVPVAGDGSAVVELDVLTAAWNDARDRALERLAAEAAACGANAVVQTELRRRAYDWAVDTIEIVASGTAVVCEEFELEGPPVLSTLSVGDVHTLVRTGWWPVGIVACSRIDYALASFQDQSAGSGGYWSFFNAELSSFTGALQATRASVMRELHRRAAEAGSAGVLDLRLEHTLHTVESNGRRDVVITMHALGSGVVPLEDDERPPDTYWAVNLR